MKIMGQIPSGHTRWTEEANRVARPLPCGTNLDPLQCSRYPQMVGPNCFS